MLALLVLVALNGECASTVEKFREKGIQYEEFGKARVLLERERCRPRQLALAQHLDEIVEKADSDVNRLILRAHLHNTFSNVCRSFNLSNNAQTSPYAIVSLQQVNGYLARFKIGWMVKKFEHDLRSLLLFNKIESSFVRLVDEKWLVDDIDVKEFVAAAVVFPDRCDVAKTVVSVLVCSDLEKSAHHGTLHAIAHAGQFMTEDDAFVYYDVPEYVVTIDGQDEVVPVELESCKIMNGSSFVCLERARSECDITTMESCDIFARSTVTNFTFVRYYGSGTIVATNQPEVNITGTMVQVTSFIFTHHTSHKLGSEDGEPQIVTYSKTTPVENEVSFPRISITAANTVHSTRGAVRLHRITRKGIPLLSDQPRKPSVWDDVRDFFSHLI